LNQSESFQYAPPVRPAREPHRPQWPHHHLDLRRYAYDTANELVSQTDAKLQTSTFTYDILGRLTQRVEADMTCVWVYDTALNGIGKVASAGITAGPSAGYQRSFAYDTLTRPTQATVTVGGTAYSFAATYDARSRLSSVAYPSGLVLDYTYTSLGYAQQIVGPGGLAYWTANARDAELHLTQETAGNGVVTTQGFDVATGRLNTILAGAGNIVQNFSYTYDVLGNVLTRADTNESLTETFTYDNINRVTSATVSASVAPVKLFAYDAIGNLLSKSGVGNYAYPLAGSALPHAVTSISGGAVSTTFTYDPNGNQTSGLGRSISYTSYNKPASITQGSGTLFFSHDVDHQRFKQVSPEGTTLYFDAFGVHSELFVAATSQWYDFIGSGGSMVGVRVLQPNNSVTTRYFHTDNLGSIAVITDESGAVVERDSYDAWGKRRFPNGADDPSGSLTSQTTRGFTGQEELTDVGLVHLNGRVYDPLVGRMMSADPFVPDPMNGQAWNRYSYVINNPLALTDTNGYCFLGMCSWGKAVSTFFNRTIGAVFRAVPVLGSLLEIAASALCIASVVCAPYAAVVAGLTTSFVAGVTSGSLSYALRAGLIAGITAAAFYEVGELTTHNPAFGTSQYFENVAGHALVGCASAVASGGKCGPAALAGAAGSAAAPFVSRDFTTGLVESSVLGGVASVAGGGKFANGAITGAFGYLFNSAAGALRGWGIGSAVGAWGAGLLGVETGPIDLAVIAAGRWVGGAIGAALGDWLTGPNIVAMSSGDGTSGGSGSGSGGSGGSADGSDPDKDLKSQYDTSITRRGSQYPNVQTDVGAQEFQQNLQSNGYNVETQNGGTTVLSDGTNTWTIYTRTSTGMPGAQFVGANGSIVKYSLGGP
jgi:RHS repeat-associated protein